MNRVELRPTIAFQTWKYSVQTAMDLDQLMLVVNSYLSGWTPEDLRELPLDFSMPITSIDELMERAVDASRAEVHFQGSEHVYKLLREMATTLAFAASRMRYLQALRTSGPT
jgi:hypothetical protein